MATNIEKLYSKVSETHSLGDLAAFREKMLNPENRQKFYNTVSEMYNLGDYEAFEGKVMGAQPVNGDGAVATMAAQAPPEVRVSPAEMLADPDALEGEINRRLERQLQPRAEPAEDIEPAAVSPENKQGILKSMTEGLTAGMYDVASIPFAITHAVAEQVGGAGAIEIGSKRIQNMLKEKAQEHPLAKELQGKNLWDNPEIILDPRFTLYGIGNMAPSFLAAMLPGAAALRFGRFAATVVGGISAGMMEGANTYGESRERGNEPDEAFKDMMLMTVGSAALNQIGFASILAKYKGKKLVQVTAAALIEGATEWLEEPLEAEILGMSGEEYEQKLKDGLAVIGPAMFMGGGGSAVSQYIQKAQDTRLKRLEKDVKTGDLVAEEQLLNERKVDQAIKDVAKQPFTGMTAEEKIELDKQQKVIDERAAEIETLFAEEEIADKKDRLAQAAALVADVDPEIKKQLDKAAAELEAPKGLEKAAEPPTKPIEEKEVKVEKEVKKPKVEPTVEKAPEKPVRAKAEERAPTGTKKAVIVPEEAAELEEPAVTEEVAPADEEEKAEAVEAKVEYGQALPADVYVHGRYGRQDIDTGHVIMGSKSWDAAERYSGKKGSIWALSPKQNAKILDAENAEQMADIKAALQKDYEDGNLQPATDEIIKEHGVDALVAEMQPDDIVNSAEAYDDGTGITEWLDGKGYHGVRVNDGIVVIDRDYFDSQKVKPETKPAAAPAEPVTEAAEVKEEPAEELIFVRKPTKAESGGGSRRQRGFNKIPDKEGYEKVYKQYGPTGEREGAGYYYKKKVAPPVEAAPEQREGEPKRQWFEEEAEKKAVQEASKIKPGEEIYSIPQWTIEKGKKTRLVRSGFYLERAGLEPVPGKLNYWRKPEKAKPAAEEVKPTEKPAKQLIAFAKSDIPEDAARRAHEGTSFVPEKRAVQEQEDYFNHIQEVHDNLLAEITPEQHDQAAEELEKYKDKYKSKLLDYLGAKSRIMSTMITGPANFPVARMEKANNAADKRYQDLVEWEKKALHGIRKRLGLTSRGAISSDDADAVQQLQAKIDKAEKHQALMKGVNKIILNKKLSDEERIAKIKEDFGLSEALGKELVKPDFTGKQGFAGYELTNNNANIRRMKKRVAQLERDRADETTEIEVGDVRIVDNVEDNRVQIFFPGKPDSETRSRLKSVGFKWAPSIGAWQRMRSPQALRFAREIIGQEPPAPGIRFARAEAKPTAKPKSVKFIEDAVGPLAAKIAVPVNTVQSVEDLPDRFQESVREEMESGGVIRGFFDPGTEEMWLIADNLRTKKQAVKTVLHEVVAHYGLRRVLGKNIDKFYRKELIEHKKYKGEIQGIADRWNLSLEDAAEEMLAGQIEDGTVKPSLMERLIAYIRRALKAVGVKFQFSEADLRVLLDDALRASMGRKRAGRGIDRFAPAFRRSLDKRHIGREIDKLSKLLAELPEERHGVSTESIQMRYLQKITELERQMVAAEQGLKFAREVFHGTPHEFEKFTTAKMGTGEGAQAFGWGLYFTDKEAIARGYAGPDRSKIGVRIKVGPTVLSRADIPWNAWQSTEELLANLEKPSVDSEQAISKYKKNIVQEIDRFKVEIVEEYGYRSDPEQIPAVRLLRQVLVDVAKDNVSKTAPARQLYTAALGKEGQEEVWLDWYEPVTEAQWQLVKNQLTEEGRKYPPRTIDDEPFTGKSLYDWINFQIFNDIGWPGGPKATSQFLSRAGFTGNRYPTGTLTGMPTEGRDEFNYVVFDEGDIEVKERLRFARAEPEESRVDKMLKQVETNLPEKGKDEIVRHRMSTLIKQKIRNIKTGARLGALDKAEELFEVKQLILEYARKNLPKKDITRGQIKPLLTQVARAKNEKDVADAFKRIDAIGRTVNEKTLRADIDKLVDRYKPKKKDGKIRGRMTADEQAKLADITAIVKMTEDQLVQMNTEVWEKIEAREEDPEPTAFEGEYIYLLGTFGNLKNKSVAELSLAKDELENLIETGRTKRQVKDEARRERRRKVREKAIGSITSGRAIKTQEEIAATGGEYKKGFFARFDDLNQSLEYLLDKLSGERGAEAMKGFMNKTFMPLVRKSRNTEHKYIREDMEVLQNKLKEIWGTSKPRGLMKIQAQNSEVVDTFIDVRQPQFTKELREQLKEGKITEEEIPTKTVRLFLSQNQAYKKLLEWQDPTLTGSFARMGYTQETIDELESFVNPKVKQWADWQMSEFYPGSYGPTNEIFREMYDIDLPFNMFYTPISRIYGKFDAQDDQLLAQNTNYNSSVLNNHLYARVRNNRALKNVDGDVVLANHVIEMAHFRAWAETIGELRSTFSNEKVRNAIAQYHGRAMLRNIDGFINDMARGGIDPRVVDKVLDKLRRNFTFAVLGINLTLIPKQIVSFPAYATNLPAKDFFSGMLDFFKNPRDNVKTLMASEMMQARYHKGFERDIMLAMQRTTQQELAGARNIRDILMFPTKFGDKAAIVMGGWSVYKYHRDNALRGTGPYKKKHSLAEAKKIALEEFEAATSRSQQAGEVEDLPTLMRRGSWTRLFTMFVTAPNAYYRMESQAVRDLVKGRGSTKENLKKFAIAHFLLPAMFQFVANGFRWKDDDQLMAAILGSLNGLLIVGSMLERGVQYFSSAAMGAGRYFFGSSDNPVFDNVNDLYLVLHRMGKMTYNKDIDVEDVTFVLDKTARVASKVVGVPYDPAKRIATGVREVIEKPTEARSYLRAAGYSEYALREQKENKSRRVGLRPVKPLRER